MALAVACAQDREAAPGQAEASLAVETPAPSQTEPVAVVVRGQEMLQSGKLVRTADQHQVVRALVGAHTRMRDPVGMGESLEQARSAGLPGGLLADEIRKSPEAERLVLDDDSMSFRYVWEALFSVTTLSDQELVRVGHWVLAHPEHRLAPELAARAFSRLAAAFARTGDHVALGKLRQRAQVAGVATAVDAAAREALMAGAVEPPNGETPAPHESMEPAPEPTLPGPAPEEIVP